VREIEGDIMSNDVQGFVVIIIGAGKGVGKVIVIEIVGVGGCVVLVVCL